MYLGPNLTLIDCVPWWSRVIKIKAVLQWISIKQIGKLYTCIIICYIRGCLYLFGRLKICVNWLPLILNCFDLKWYLTLNIFLKRWLGFRQKNLRQIAFKEKNPYRIREQNEKCFQIGLFRAKANLVLQNHSLRHRVCGLVIWRDIFWVVCGLPQPLRDHNELSVYRTESRAGLDNFSTWC